MASDISSGGSSNFLANRKYFRPNVEQAKEEVEVFVEDEVDTIFWRYFLSKNSCNKQFRIRVLRTHNNELCGKDALVKYVKIDSLGVNKLIAIDSDYDYIIDNYHPYTNELVGCKYVIHTIDAYSIENYKIVPSILNEAIYLTSFCEQIKEDVSDMLIQASKAYFILFTIHLFSTNNKDRIYKQSDFKLDLSKLTYQYNIISHSTKTCIAKRIQSFNEYLNRNKGAYDTFIQYLNEKGILEENCWQYINGHDAFEEIGVKIVSSLTCRYRGEYVNWIYASVGDPKQRDNLLRKFEHSTGVFTEGHSLKDRIREILYDIHPDIDWEISIKNGEQIRTLFP